MNQPSHRPTYPPFGLILTAVVLICALMSGLKTIGGWGTYITESKLERFMRVHELTLDAYPPELLDLMARNPETEDFVVNYPINKEKNFEIDLSAYRSASSVPLLMQWDERWGYETYGSGLLAMTGCGPTCLSMVTIYLTHDTSFHPGAAAAFSTAHGYAVKGNGTSWTLMSEGGPLLGMNVKEIPLDRDRLTEQLRQGHPVVCIMGPGDFTDTGHYIVMTGIEKGKIRINDPNSCSNSRKLWEFDDIKGQIRNLWAFSV
ncbi:MAG: C39 family peptidase [Clostridia bacterium]|nr:C39 family peptidase [Clostridia bacterium]